MNHGRYFMPMTRQNPMMYANSLAARGNTNFNISGLLSKLGNTIKGFNWQGLLSGVNKTLNVVNQTIPLVRQAKPMFDNVKSMILLTKTFRRETNNDSIIYNKKDEIKKDTLKLKSSFLNSDIQEHNIPKFFI